MFVVVQSSLEYPGYLLLFFCIVGLQASVTFMLMLGGVND